MLKIFIGYDPRQPVAYNVLQHSIFTRSSQPVSITPLALEQLPITRVGLTPFTYTRFLVPYLCNYEGWALFLDIDMLLVDDIAKLFALADDRYTVMVSKNEQRFEWASAMLFNCAKCKILTPDYIENPYTANLHSIGWAKEEEVGSLPPEWNHLVGYDKPRDDAKLIHFTQGVPVWPETQGCEYTKEWFNEVAFAYSAMPWATLMGDSVHATVVNGKKVPKLSVRNSA